MNTHTHKYFFFSSHFHTSIEFYNAMAIVRIYCTHIWPDRSVLYHEAILFRFSPFSSIYVYCMFLSIQREPVMYVCESSFCRWARCIMKAKRTKKKRKFKWKKNLLRTVDEFDVLVCVWCCVGDSENWGESPSFCCVSVTLQP